MGACDGGSSMECFACGTEASFTVTAGNQQGPVAWHVVKLGSGPSCCLQASRFSLGFICEGVIMTLLL